jgi:GH15 family glucan-1,4-alpha-glucosidase
MPARAPRIADYALIGDWHTAALVSRDGAIDWCCLPRFDGGSCFGRLLDPAAGTCVVTVDDADGAGPSSQDYLDGTLVLATTLRASGGEARLLDCMTLDGERDGVPDRRTILRVVEGVRGAVPLRLLVAPRFDYGEVVPWIRHHGTGVYSLIGGNDGLLCWSDAPLAPDDEQALAAGATVRAGERVRLLLEYRPPEQLDAGTDPPEPEALDRRLEETIGAWRAWSGRARIRAVDEAGVLRSALVIKALSYAPTGAIVAAATTSLPETTDGARTWDYRYAWVRDSVLATRSLARLGYEAEADAFRRFIERSAAGSARDLQVLYGVGGERRMHVTEVEKLAGFGGGGVVRVGNDAAQQLQLDAYGHLLEQSWRWYERGNPPDDDYWRFLVDLVENAVERWRDPDHGLWEWRGKPRHFVYSKALCWVAVHRGLGLAERCMRKAPERRWRRARREIREAIESEGYDANRGTFVQAFGDPALDAAVLRLPTVGFLAYDDERMVSTADALREQLGDGGGLIRRYDADDGIPGREGAFLACTFWLVECLARQNRPEDARDIFDKAIATANSLGLFAEEFDSGSGQMLGNFPQALTHLAHIEAALALADSAAVTGDHTSGPPPRVA